jgi:isoleucyl-tRNA synthetase
MVQGIGGSKAMHWNISCKTARAEAGVQYENHRRRSIYVSYPVTA